MLNTKNKQIMKEKRINIQTIQFLIQNRVFDTEAVYLPPHDLIKKCQKCNLITILENSNKCIYCKNETQVLNYGLLGICDYSGFIPLELLKKLRLEKYLCVKTPYRDYIKNKYIQSFRYILENKDIMSLEKTRRISIGIYSDGIFLLNKRFQGLGNGDKSSYNYVHSVNDDLDKINIETLKKLCQFYTILFKEVDINLKK